MIKKISWYTILIKRWTRKLSYSLFTNHNTMLLWIPRYLHSSPSNVFSYCQSYGIGRSPKLKVTCRTKSHVKLVLPRWQLVLCSSRRYLTTKQDLDSSSSDLDSLLAAGKTTTPFNLVPSTLAVKHTLTKHFSCLDVFKQADYVSCLLIVLLHTMSF